MLHVSPAAPQAVAFTGRLPIVDGKPSCRALAGKWRDGYHVVWKSMGPENNLEMVDVHWFSIYIYVFIYLFIIYLYL